LPHRADPRHRPDHGPRVHRGGRGHRERPPGAADAPRPDHGAGGNSRRPAVVHLYWRGAGHRLAGRGGGPRRSRLCAGGARPLRGRPRGLAARPSALPPGDQRPRRLRHRGRALGVRQARRVRGGGGRHGRHAGAPLPGDAVTTPNPLKCDPDELRTLFLFEKLTDEQLDHLCREGHVELIGPGVVYTEADPATCFYVLIEVEVVTSRKLGGDDVEIGRTSQRGVYGGAWNAYLGDRVPQVYGNSMRATDPSRFFVLGADCFAEIVQDWFPMAVHLLEGLFFGSQRTREAVGQRERLLALGSLTAGLTHELNNPAAAAVRAAARPPEPGARAARQPRPAPGRQA